MNDEIIQKREEIIQNEYVNIKLLIKYIDDKIMDCFNQLSTRIYNVEKKVDDLLKK